MINGDLPLETAQIKRTKSEVKAIKESEDLDEYNVEKDGTKFVINGKKYSFAGLLPKEVFYSLAMCEATINHLHLTINDSPLDPSFENFVLQNVHFLVWIKPLKIIQITLTRLQGLGKKYP